MSLIAQTQGLGYLGQIPYSPLILGASLLVWLEAGNATSDGSLLSVPNGGSAPATQFFQSRLINLPAIITGTDGQKSIRLDANDYLEANDSIDLVGNWTFYSVVKSAGTNTGSLFTTDASGRGIRLNNDTAEWLASTGTGGTLIAAVNAGNFQVVKDTSLARHNTIWTVGKNGETAACDWKAIIVINRQLNVNESTAIETWLAGRC